MISHETANIYLDKSGHVRFDFKKNAKVELSHMAEYLKIIEEICGGVKRCFILDTRGTFATGTGEARKFIGQNPQALKWRKADVILLDNMAVKLVGNFYKKLEAKNHPVRLFSNEQKALKWLDQF